VNKTGDQFIFSSIFCWFFKSFSVFNKIEKLFWDDAETKSTKTVPNNSTTNMQNFHERTEHLEKLLRGPWERCNSRWRQRLIASAMHLERRNMQLELERQRVVEERWAWLDEFFGPAAAFGSAAFGSAASVPAASVPAASVPAARRVSFSQEVPEVTMIEVDLSSFSVKQPWREQTMGDGAIVAARQKRKDIFIKRAEELDTGSGCLTCESKLVATWAPSPNPTDGGLMRPYYYNEDTGISHWCNCSKRTLSAIKGKHCQGSCRLVACGGARQSTVEDVQERYMKTVC
jgi:hypothetical protein